jgi:sec-independent protein translocase protein TatC
MNDSAEIDLSKAPLLSHLLELRRRLLFCLLAFTGVFVVCYLVAEPIYAFLMRPLVDAFGEASGRRMIYTGLEEAFLTYVKLAFFAALFLTLPLMLIQVWKFVAPGLYRNEKRSLGKVFAFTPVLFLTGAAMAYYFVFPLAWKFFLGFESSGADTGIPVQMETRVSEYLGLVIHMILAFGLSFELPVLLYILGEIGIVSSRMLAENRRYAIVTVYAIAGVITPPDLFSQIALGTPLLALYEISILLIRRSEHRRDADSKLPQPQTSA